MGAAALTDHVPTPGARRLRPARQRRRPRVWDDRLPLRRSSKTAPAAPLRPNCDGGAASPRPPGACARRASLCATDHCAAAGSMISKYRSRSSIARKARRRRLPCPPYLLWPRSAGHAAAPSGMVRRSGHQLPDSGQPRPPPAARRHWHDRRRARGGGVVPIRCWARACRARHACGRGAAFEAALAGVALELRERRSRAASLPARLALLRSW